MKKLINTPLAVLTFICVTAYLLFWHYYVMPLNHKDDLFPYQNLWVTLITLFFCSCIFGVLLALIPFKGTKYGQRVLNATCVGTIFTCLIFGVPKYLSGPQYYYIQAASDCSSIKTGHFRVGEMDIVRTEDHQVQTDLKTGKKNEFSVVWLSECEYKLINEKGRSIQFKVTAVDAGGYTCSGYSGGSSGKPIRVDRFKESK